MSVEKQKQNDEAEIKEAIANGVEAVWNENSEVLMYAR